MHDAGFWIEPSVISEEECDRLTAALSGAKRSRAGIRHLMSHPAVAAIANDSRLIAIAQKAVGPGAVPFRATLFEKTGDKNWLIAWHQDTALPLETKFDAPGWGPWSEKDGVIYAHAPASALERVIALRLHLDVSTTANGPLRVVPGRRDQQQKRCEEVCRHHSAILPPRFPSLPAPGIRYGGFPARAAFATARASLRAPLK